MKKIKTVETIGDIVAELRERAWKWTKDKKVAKLIEEYADRIEAAYDRDTDMIAEAAYVECEKAYSER